MLLKCCLCIDLRVGTLLLAVLGAVSHFYNAFVTSSLPPSGTESDYFMTVFSTMSYVAALASVAGFVGVVRRNPRLVKVFSAYAFAELALSFFLAVFVSLVLFSVREDVCQEALSQPEMDGELDFGTCLRYYDGIATGAIIGIAIGLLLRRHFAMAIRAYYLTLREDTVKTFGLRCRASYFAYPVVYTAVPAGVVDEDSEETLERPPAYEEASKVGLSAGDIKL
jgi:hypothetical protein